MLTKESFFFVDTTKETHFTDELVAGASEYENLVVTQSGHLKCYITSICMRTATNHAFTVAFYSRNGSANEINANNPHMYLASTRYQPLLIDYWPFASGNAWVMGPSLGSPDTANVTTATEFVYSVTGLKIPYLDEDNSGTLHIGLHNLDKRRKAKLGEVAGNIPSGVYTQYIQIRFGLISAT